MKKILLFLFITLSLHSWMKGNNVWRSIDNNSEGKCISITTIESDYNKYKAKVSIHGYYDNIIDIDGSFFHQLSFDEPATLSYIGEPALPIISRYIALPRGENFEVKIEDEKWSDNMYVGQIMPYQRSFLETEKIPPFEKNETVYCKDVYLSEMFHIGDLQKWRGINNRVLNICPIKYMPQEGTISVLKEFVLEISFDKTDFYNLAQFNDMYLFLNQIKTSSKECVESSRDADSYDYLIIAGNIPGVLECQALADFRKWKAFKGYKTKVVSTNTIGSSTFQIKNYISIESSKGVKYVLFIGDYDKIPLYNYYLNNLQKYTYSDYWYGCLDGNNDVEADICIGRFSTNNLSELANMVNKTIFYEKNPRNYGEKILLVAHREGAPGKYQGCSETIRTGNYNESISFTTAYGASSTVNGDSATNNYVISNINAGNNIINYRGHGSSKKWNDWNINHEHFRDTLINVLNETTNDIYFCVACSLGHIQNPTCFMETFMRSNHGAAGMIAASKETYTLANHSFNQYLFSKLFNENIYNIGYLNISAHIANLGSLTGSEYDKAEYNAFSYLCGCDPSLEILTGNTKNFNNYTLTLGGQNLTITNGNTNEYKVNVVNEDGTLSFVVNSPSYSCTIPMPTENFYLILNKHNYVPRIIYVNVTDNYIQNKCFDNIDMEYYYIRDATINVGYDVTSSVPYGNVTIENGSKLTIDKSNGVIFKNGTECKLGGILEIK